MAETVKKAKASKPKATSKPKAAAKPNGKAATNGSALHVTAMKLSHDQIAQLAHRYWAERGHQHGRHEEDWFRAEQALRQKAS
jgi:hypothetical protein